MRSASAPRVLAVRVAAPRVGKSRVFRDEANLVDADAGVAATGEIDCEAVGEWYSLRARFHEALHQIGEFCALDARKETDAGDSGGVEEISEITFGGAGFQGAALEQKLRTGGSQQKATLPRCSYRCLQFRPCGIELAGRAGML